MTPLDEDDAIYEDEYDDDAPDELEPMEIWINYYNGKPDCLCCVGDEKTCKSHDEHCHKFVATPKEQQ